VASSRQLECCELGTWRLPCDAGMRAKTARVLDPVSSNTVKGWRGEPMDMFARNAVLEPLSTTGTWSTPCLYLSLFGSST